jgi:hypothetical protein
MMNRVADINDSMMFCMDEESVKPAYMRKKVSQGRNTDSQGDVQKQAVFVMCFCKGKPLYEWALAGIKSLY